MRRSASSSVVTLSPSQVAWQLSGLISSASAFRARLGANRHDTYSTNLIHPIPPARRAKLIDSRYCQTPNTSSHHHIASHREVLLIFVLAVSSRQSAFTSQTSPWSFCQHRVVSFNSSASHCLKRLMKCSDPLNTGELCAHIAETSNYNPRSTFHDATQPWRIPIPFNFSNRRPVRLCLPVTARMTLCTRSERA